VLEEVDELVELLVEELVELLDDEDVLLLVDEDELDVELEVDELVELLVDEEVELDEEELVLDEVDEDVLLEVVVLLKAEKSSQKNDPTDSSPTLNFILFNPSAQGSSGEIQLDQVPPSTCALT